MALLVIALGFALSAVGAYEVYVGNSFISIERGWSAFISGSVLFTGGIVVIAIGCAIKAVGDLRRALIVDGAGAARQMPMSLATQHVGAPDVASGLPTEPTLAARAVETSPAATVLTPTEANGGPARLASAPDRNALVAPAVPEVPARVLDGSRAAASPEPPRSRLRRDRSERTREPAAVAEDISMPPVERAPSTAPTAPPDARNITPASASGTGNGDADNLPAIVMPPPPRPELPPQPEPSRPPPRPAETAPAMDDWLDRSFADLDREVADLYPRGLQKTPASLEPTAAMGHEVSGTAAPTIAAERPVHAGDDGPTTHADALPPHRDDADVEGESEYEPHDSPVIGRYEADGTTYIMYADGSIEAQSEAGVYRFGSMAELKSFIES